MFRELEDPRQQMQMVSIEDLVPADHLLRRVDAVLDLRWLAGRVAPLYNATQGAPVIPPERVMRLLLAGWLLGCPGLRPLLRRAQTDAAIRWFARCSLTDRLPDHSSLSKILKRWGGALFAELFERTVQQCLDAKLVDGEVVHYDGTLVRADVSAKSLTRRYEQQVYGEEEEELDEATALEAAEERDGAPPAVRFAAPGEALERQTKKRSRTDPDCTLATNRKNKPLAPCYKAHIAVDGQCAVVVGVQVTTGEQSEQQRFIGLLDEVCTRLGVRVRTVTGDAGCASASNYARLELRAQAAVIPPGPPARGRRRRDGTVNQVPLRRFRYDPCHDRVVCPRGTVLQPGAREVTGQWYRAPASACEQCPLYRTCVPPTARRRSVRIQDGYEAWLRARRAKERGWPAAWEEAYAEHRYEVEGWHGEAKECHGLRRAVFRGLGKMRVQLWLTAAVMNLKKLAKAAAAATRSRIAVLRRLERVQRAPARCLQRVLASPGTAAARWRPQRLVVLGGGG